jgi:CRP/FNR family transcriptional regulator
MIHFREPATQQLKQVETEPMNTPYGLDMVENCMTCKLRKEGWYCSLQEDLLKSFSGHSHLTTYPGGAILFVAGQMPRGAFVLCSGKVKLSTTSKEGKVLVLKMAEPGEIIGLSAMISGEAYEVTAETVGPCLVNLVEREGLLRLMERSGELGLRSALAVSREFQSAYRDINDFVLVRSSSANWRGCCSHGSEVASSPQMTHEFKRRQRTKRWRRELAPLVKPLPVC